MTADVDVALATALELSEPDLDLEPLRERIASRGLRCAVLAWDDARADFGAAAVTVLRSTWNYPLRTARFLEWIDATAASSALWNGAAAVRWNLHKRYLLELEAAGVRVTPTELLRRGTTPRLAEIARRREWKRVVVKPAVSASSMQTFSFSADDFGRGQAHLTKLASSGDVLVQEYLPSVEEYGERALVWIDGELTHAVRKSPRFSGDEESTSARAVAITAEERRLAQQALREASKAIAEPLLYARIDVAPAPSGTPLLMELELIEPSLYLERSERAFDRFVASICALVPERPPAG